MKGQFAVDFKNTYQVNLLLIGGGASKANAMLPAAGSKNTGSARSLTGDVKSDFIVGTRDVSAARFRSTTGIARLGIETRDGINLDLMVDTLNVGAAQSDLIAGLYRRVFFWSF